MKADEFIGGQFEWFTGIVKDINDPLNLNRVKVHCLGFYDGIGDNKHLPWATVIMPATTASMKGNGGNHHLEVGSWVVGFFRDGPSAQDPMIMGSVATQTDGVQDIPTESSVENKVYKSKAGHLIEIDNTAGAERLNVKHTSGTTILIDAEGGIQIDAVNDIINIDGNTKITGTLTVTDATTLESTLDVTDAQTNSSTITASGEVTSGSVTLTGHTHNDTPGLAAGTTTPGSG
jgi:hypothetical protein